MAGVVTDTAGWCPNAAVVGCGSVGEIVGGGVGSVNNVVKLVVGLNMVVVDSDVIVLVVAELSETYKAFGAPDLVG